MTGTGTSRRCPRCGHDKPAATFLVRRTGRYAGNLYGYCTPCRAAWQRNRYRTNPIYRLARLCASARSRAKHLRILFSITPHDLAQVYDLQQGRCALTGRPLQFTGPTKDPEGISIDRIDSDRGYTIDNIWLVCSRANSMKMEGTIEDLLDWCRDVISHCQGGHEPPPKP